MLPRPPIDKTKNQKLQTREKSPGRGRNRRALRPNGAVLPSREGGAPKTRRKTNLFHQPDLTPDRDHRLLAPPKETPHHPHLYASPELRADKHQI
ncbi:hypothetical protein Bca4012_058231 [Brassica carinata]